MGGAVSISGAVGAAGVAGAVAAAPAAAQWAGNVVGGLGEFAGAVADAGVTGGGGSDSGDGSLPAGWTSATAKLQGQATNMALNAKITPRTSLVDFTKP